MLNRVLPSRSTRLAAAGLLAASVTAATLATGVGSASALADPPTIVVTANVHSLTLSGPSTVQAGRYKLHFRSTVPATEQGGGSDIEVVKPNAGVSYQQVRGDIYTAMGEDPKAASAAVRRLNAETRAFGGALIGPGQLVNNTLTLLAGTYFFTDFVTGQVTPLNVVGSPVDRTFPATNATITMKPNDRFGTPAVLPQNASYLIRNDGDTLHFIEFQPVAPGTTDQDIANFFNAIVHGQDPGRPPFTGPAIGTGVLTPGNQMVWAAHLAPGTYVELCFVPDDETGMPHAFMGMHTIVHVK